ncbi:hypothetical protein [Acinetobacter seifertii]|uniref:Uncharacterized protein n=1 Tax=Acinetobacter seifertii TaxID=1530123 RepID=A0A7H2V2Z7_9GAMM|nr:hypothetical protein [Acinetobacter seifertii]MBZ6535519.1 hypothetical protein [Acinetobacter seifertii]QNX70730.1 hypothetical protein IC776_09455 [Acinetobacter seifertii]
MMSVSDIAALHTLVITVFVAGAALGLFVSGLIGKILNMLSYRFERPKRIKTETGFLYLFKGKYYSIEQRNKLLVEHRKRFKHLPP